jgi:hypothetical protein
MIQATSNNIFPRVNPPASVFTRGCFKRFSKPQH